VLVRQLDFILTFAVKSTQTEIGCFDADTLRHWLRNDASNEDVEHFRWVGILSCALRMLELPWWLHLYTFKFVFLVLQQFQLHTR